MIELSPDEFRSLVAEARLAPSVHNIQPTRWSYEHGQLTLLGDTRRSIPAADPTGRDWRLSHGAALEGLALAAAQRGIAVAASVEPARRIEPLSGEMQPLARCAFAPLAGSRPEREPTGTRTSWRGGFAPTDDDVSARLDRLAIERDDLLLVRERPFVEHAARLADEAGLHFLRDDAHRKELLHWLRLSPSHPEFSRDGLNAIAMNLGRAEAFGAGLVLGPMFRALDRAGLAPGLVSEYRKTRTAAAIALFHRPAGEDAFQSGRAFYRAWLAMERAGLKGAPMSVLVDWPVARNALHRLYGLGPDRFIVSAFRIGRPAGRPSIERARLSVDELII